MIFPSAPAGTGFSRTGKGGLPARLFFFTPVYFFPRGFFFPRVVAGMVFLAGALSMAVTPASALESPMQSFLGLDLRRQIWMPALPPTAPDTLTPPRFSAALEYGFLDLIRKPGGFFYDYGENVAALRLSSAAVPGMDFRFSAERADRVLDIGDTSTSADLGGRGWGWSGTAAYRYTPWLIPSVTVGGESRTGRETAQRAVGMRGRFPLAKAYLEWSGDLGERKSDYPLMAHLKDYRPLELSLQLRKRYGQASLEYRRDAWSARWDGEWTRLHYPHVPSLGYYLADSGSTWTHGGKLAYEGAGSGEGLRASADLRLGFGSHVFRGANRKETSQTRFSYQEAEQRSYSARADMERIRKGFAWGAYLGAAELEYDALRPATAFNRHFWDRNGVIDSYQGSLLGLFSTETWLLNGAIYAAQGGGGLWAAKAWRGWRGQAGLGYTRLVLEANSSLTKRESAFLLAFTEEDFAAEYPKVTADIVTPELRVSGSAGNVFLSLEAAQALPLRVRIDRSGTDPQKPVPGSDDGYSGGTRGKIVLGWRVP